MNFTRMNTPESINQFCAEFGYKPMNTKTEFKLLPSLIDQDEVILGITEGFLKDIGKRTINGTGILIVTNRRVIFYRKSFIGTETREEIPLNRISSASFRKGLIFGTIIITSSNNDAIIENCNKKQAEDVVKVIMGALNNNQAPQPKQTNTESLSQQLEKLFELKEKGILTEDEFTQQKSKILNV